MFPVKDKPVKQLRTQSNLIRLQQPDKAPAQSQS